ncbi:retropepsin-like aspartic protease [Sinomicrobium weinanense]|uniref:Retropepsin-like domain-containing protein n=1 Tax=Sinomicrobium weinanense TaxID=2842200 RepID=A0A926Q356_9FLAO|nr:retropepsin-like aspartic protease [Sinomicrobium weinanense]MBC9795400.1 retropepsin-like domain-containing protein [Sinomicrobium weinanense]MBU3123925.1 retropepsin-like domain-containing protein [Sinomicrobium weinanense]
MMPKFKRLMMKKVITPLMILLATLTYAQGKITEPVKVPFTQTSDGHIIIAAKVNGVEGKFIFDTGAGLNLLTKKFADKVKNLEKTHHFYTGHRATGEELHIDLWNSRALDVGSFTVKNEIFSVYDIDLPLDGLISLTPFKDYPVTIDFEHKVLSIESGKSLKELIRRKDFEMPVQVSNDREIAIEIATKVQLDDKLTLNVRLDSGAGFGVYRFSSVYMKKLNVDPDKVRNEFKPSYFKPEEGNRYYYTELSKMTDVNKNVAIKDFGATFIDGLIYEGIMGINWIGKKITIDLSNKRLIVQK